MRPDKQKAKYKKKAGYGPNSAATVTGEKPGQGQGQQKGGDKGAKGADGKKNRDKEGHSKDAPPTTSSSSSSAKVTSTTLPAADSRRRKDSDSDSGSDWGAETSGGDHGKPQYRRRTIQSNWTRYEEPEPEVDDKQEVEFKTNEFQRLLTAKVTAGSHLVLEDERDWLADEGQDDVISDYLGLDCEALAAAVRTIPLHERLGVETIAEQAGIIEEFNQQISDHLTSNTDQSNRKFSFKTPSKTSTKADSTALTQSLSKTLNIIPTEAIAVTETENPASMINDSKEIVQTVDNEQQIPHQETPTKPENKQTETETETVYDDTTEVELNWDNVPDEEADLDPTPEVEVELNWDNVKSEEVESEVTKNQESKSELDIKMGNSCSEAAGEENYNSILNKIPKSEDEELDFLLSLDAPVTKVNTKVALKTDTKAKAKVSEPVAETTEENLEEWLDSIL